MLIRPATPSDAAALSQLICQNAQLTLAPHYSPEQMHTFLTYYDTAALLKKIDTQAVYCAVTDDAILGTIALDGDFVVGFYTHVDQLGRGIGSALMRHLEQVAVSKGLDKIRLAASPNSTAFYHKYGFITLETSILNYLGVDFEETLMEKCLNQVPLNLPK